MRTLSLSRALGIRASGTWAFVGAGGKTAAIRRLLQEHPDASATTTTHLAAAGFGVGMLVVAPDRGALARLVGRIALRPLTFAGAGADARLQAPPPDWLWRFVASHSPARLFVEADGAARRLVKLPGAHEPVWPAVPLAAAVIVVGTAALGRAVHDAAHHPERFVGAGIRSERVTRRHLTAMLDAYLARTPPRVPVVVLLTGIAAEQMDLARQLTHFCRETLQRRDPRRHDPGVALRVVATPDIAAGPFAVWHFPRARQRLWVPAFPDLEAVLLAAGSGRRYGDAPDGTKLLLRWRGRSLIEHSTRAWGAAGCAALLVVTGHAAATIEPQVRRIAARTPSPWRIVRNRVHARGLGSSVRIAARRATRGRALLFGHADMPALRPATLQRIAAVGTALRDRIVVPTVGGAPRNPVYFPADLRAELTRVADARGGKPVLMAHPQRVFRLAMDDVAGEFIDVDRRGDWRRLARG